MSRTNPNWSCQRRAVTFIEVLVVVAVILLLLAILFPNLGHAREQSRRVLCQNNLHQWGIAGQLYRDENADYLPTEGTYWDLDKPYSWFNVLPPYLSAPPYREVEGVGKDIREFPELHMWICPSKNLSKYYKSVSGKNQFHYGMNEVLDGMNSSLAPGSKDQGELPIQARLFYRKPNTVFLFDIYTNDPSGNPTNVRTDYHRGIANVLMLNGSVSPFQAKAFVKNGDFEHPVPNWTNPQMYWGYLPKPN